MSSTAAVDAFREFLEFVLTKYFRRNQQAFADAVGITTRSLRRTLDPSESRYTFSEEHCLRLAKALHGHVNATYVLMKADKSDHDALIRELYGRARLSKREEALFDAWNAVDAPIQDEILKWAQQAARIAERDRLEEPPPTSATKRATRGRRKR